MGYGGWNDDDFQRATARDRAAGRDPFHYGQTATQIHSLLDPRRVASDRSPFAGQVMREVAVTSDHPKPTPIVLGLDVTASNSVACYKSHEKLGLLFGVLQKCVSDPQLMMAAIGDANSDRFPLQVGDFESDNRVADQVKAMILEMGGGGQHHETYELLAYFLVKHTMLQPFYTQKRKGYCFLVGDEMPYDTVKAHQVNRIIGDDTETDVSTAEVFKTLQQQYRTYFLFQAQGSHTEQQIMPTWRELLGENALILEDPANVCEVIAGIVAMTEQGVQWVDIEQDLQNAGFDQRAITATGKTLQHL